MSHSEYAKAVLEIETAVTVILAEKKVLLSDVVDLAPGSMLTFDVHCDRPLTLTAGGHAIARGETVKVGDKFGLKVREVLGPMKIQ